jgi:hypothetical protein
MKVYYRNFHGVWKTPRSMDYPTFLQFLLYFGVPRVQLPSLVLLFGVLLSGPTEWPRLRSRSVDELRYLDGQERDFWSSFSWFLQLINKEVATPNDQFSLLPILLATGVPCDGALQPCSSAWGRSLDSMSFCHRPLRQKSAKRQSGRYWNWALESFSSRDIDTVVFDILVEARCEATRSSGFARIWWIHLVKERASELWRRIRKRRRTSSMY